jgi:purine-binding chemotaxis protein CheW
VHFLRIALGDTAYAVAIERVVEIAPRVKISPLPDAPSFVEGVFAYRQAACVAVSLRRRFGHPERAASLDEHIVVVRGRRRLLGLVVDRAIGDEVVPDAEIEKPETRTNLIAGVVPGTEGVLLIHDVDALLSDDEEARVDQSLAT